MYQEPTRIVRRSSLIPAIREQVEPELEPLIPAEPQLSLAAYSLWLESLLKNALKG